MIESATVEKESPLYELNLAIRLLENVLSRFCDEPKTREKAIQAAREAQSDALELMKTDRAAAEEFADKAADVAQSTYYRLMDMARD